MRLLMRRKQYLGGNRFRNLGHRVKSPATKFSRRLASTLDDPWHRYLTANSDRLSHFGNRMSLFLQTLVVRGILSGEQAHRLEEFHMKMILTQYVVCALAVALTGPLAQAQPAGI